MMSDILSEAVAALNEKLGGADFDGSAKFDIVGEGAVMIDANGARAADEEADVTLSADAETFKEILDGETNPTSAFMTGKLKVDGDMGMAMKLAAVLA
jgi:putative sterol carrier protein